MASLYWDWSPPCVRISTPIRNGSLSTAESEKHTFAGAFDSLTSFGTGADQVGISRHYETCVRNAKMDLSQLTQNVIRFARDKPELHTGSVQLALLRYLIAACGQPPVK